MKALTPEEAAALGLENDSSPIETAIQAEGLKPHEADFVRSIYQQESGGGANTATSNQGAVGGMQIQPKTFDEVKDPEWNIKHPVHNARAGVRYAVKMLHAADNDPRRAAAGYYGGPAGLDAAKKSQPLYDKKNPDAPSTLQYGDQVASRLSSKLVPLSPEEHAAIGEAPNYGARPDGTAKGNGYFGPLKMQDGSSNVATEMSIGVNFDGKETQIPSLVPTLSEEQKQYLLKGGSPNARPDIINAAVEHAKKRMLSGVSPYAETTSPIRNKLASEMDSYTAPFKSGESIPYLGGSTGALDRYREAQDMNPFKKTMISAGHELSKLGAGAAEVGDFGQFVFGDPKKAVASVMQRHLDQAEQDKLYQPFDASGGISQVVGGALPYFVSGVTAGPAAGRLGSAAVDKLISVPVGAASKTARGITSDTANFLKSSKFDPVSKLGSRIEQEIIVPTERAVARKAVQPSLPDPYYKGSMSDIAGSMLLGGAEGGLHYDNSIASGAASGALGAFSSLGMKKLTNRLPDYRSPPVRNLLEWYKDKGGKPSIGLDSGSSAHQNFESQMGKSNDWADAFLMNRQENRLVDNNVAYKAMGINAPIGTHLSPAELADHQQNLKNQFQELEKGTVAKFMPVELSALDKHVQGLKQSGSMAAAKDAVAAQRYFDLININAGVRRIPGSKRILAKRALDGKVYQKVSQDIQADITGAYKEGKISRAKALEPIKEALDKAVERGVAEARGDATVANWRDLRRNYAMSHIVYEHGLSPEGVDAHKLYTYFAGQDPKRLFLEQGPSQLNELQKLAKIAYLEKHQDKSMGSVKQAGRQSVVQSLLGLPGGGKLPLVSRAALSMYNSGYPAKTGLLNMGEGHEFQLPFTKTRFSLPQLWASPLPYTRAVSQSEQLPRKAEKFILESKQLQRIKDYLKQK